MKDKAFLQWLHDRLELVHNENPSYDYMWKLRAVIKTIPEDQDSDMMDGFFGPKETRELARAENHATRTQENSIDPEFEFGSVLEDK